MLLTKIGVAVTALSLLAAPVAAADTELTELKVVAAFDKPEYTSGGLVKLTLTVTNVGTVAAEKVISDSGGTFSPENGYWGDLDFRSQGSLIQPGETRVFEFSGYLQQATGAVTSGGKLVSPTVKRTFEPMWFITALVRAATGGWHGVVYGDKNLNGQPDPGEYLQGVKVNASGGVPYQTFAGTTGADGKFDFQSMPTGRYFTSFQDPNGWLFDTTGYHVVEEGPAAETVLRGLRPLSEQLSVSITFKKKSYQPDELVKANVKLTNRGTTPINGIITNCNGIGDPNQLNGDDGWGPLAYNAAGVNLAPGQTKVIPVSEAVPAAAQRWGEVRAGCMFGSNAYAAEGWPYASDGARVPGIRGGLDAKVVVSRTETPIAGLTVRVTDPYTKKVVAQPVTDAEGRFKLRDMQVGTYDVTYLGPWKPAGTGYNYLRIWADSTGEYVIGLDPCP